MRSLGLAALAVLAAVALGACGDDSEGNGGADQEALLQALQDEGATEGEARCILDEVGHDDAERLVSALRGDTELSADERERIRDVPTECASAATAENDGGSEEEGTDEPETATIEQEPFADGDVAPRAEVVRCLEEAGFRVTVHTRKPKRGEKRLSKAQVEVGETDLVLLSSPTAGSGSITFYEAPRQADGKHKFNLEFHRERGSHITEETLSERTTVSDPKLLGLKGVATYEYGDFGSYTPEDAQRLVEDSKVIEGCM